MVTITDSKNIKNTNIYLMYNIKYTKTQEMRCQKVCITANYIALNMGNHDPKFFFFSY